MKKILLSESEKKAIIADKEKAIIESFTKTFNKIKRIDENELSQDIPTNNIDQNTTLAYNIIKSITDLLKDDMYVEPDEYGMRTPELLKAFFYNFDSVDNPTTGEILGWKRGDIKTFTNRVKAYLSNNDIVAINDSGIDVANSNHPEVAKLLVKLDTL